MNAMHLKTTTLVAALAALAAACPPAAAQERSIAAEPPRIIIVADDQEFLTAASAAESPAATLASARAETPATAQAAPSASTAAEQAGASDAKAAEREARREFNRLVNERDELHARLESLDAKALAAMKDGQRPVDVHAEQISVQDRLDLIALRLELLAMRHDLTIPPVRSGEDEAVATAAGVAAPEPKIDAFTRASRRTLKQLRAQTREMLAALDIEAFLEQRAEATR